MVLRKRFTGGYQVNYWIGDQWHLVEEYSKDEFQKACESYFGVESNDLSKECYAFVIHNFTKSSPIQYEPLYKGQMAWILSPDGQQFADLTSK